MRTYIYGLSDEQKQQLCQIAQQCYVNRETNACEMVKKTYIRNAKPDYCKTYFEHGWITTGEKLRYVGSEKNGGRWVE